MKKFLAIVVLGLLWSGNAYSNNYFKNCKVEKENVNYIFDLNSKTVNASTSNGFSRTYKLESIDQNIIKTEKTPWIRSPVHAFQYVFDIKAKTMTSHRYKGQNRGYDKYDSGNNGVTFNCLEVNFTEKITKQLQTAKQDAIMFTIKDKREQCEAIGFKPKTEKFADCVLRLVELDIKKQQDNKIAAAQNSGNMQIANQLLQMRNDNNAQYLIDLGQQLLTPQSFNSNIYLPQTQNCTIMGFDSFAKMTCN